MRNKFFFILILVTSFGLSNAAAQTPKPRTISGGVVNGKATSLPKPPYPAAAHAVKASGAVNVQVTIDENGNVVSASAVSGHPLLRQAAEQAALQSTFKPTLLSGQPVRVTGVIVYNFVAAEEPEEVPVWGLGMFLSFLQNADSTLIKEVDDKKELDGILAELASEIPAELAAEKLLFDKLAKSTGETRRAVAGELLGAVKKHLNGEEKWQLEIGEHLGAAFVELIKHGKNGGGGSAAINESALKANLQKIRDSLFAEPPDASPELIKKFKSVADFADAPELSSPETLAKLFQTLEPLFGSFSDE